MTDVGSVSLRLAECERLLAASRADCAALLDAVVRVVGVAGDMFRDPREGHSVAGWRLLRELGVDDVGGRSAVPRHITREVMARLGAGGGA